MTAYGRFLKVLIFYFLVAFIVVFVGPTGHLVGYVLIGAITIPFMITSGIKLWVGNPLPGSAAGITAITATFLVVLALGGAAVAGLNGNTLDVLAFGLVLQAFVACGEELSFRQYVFEELDRTAGRKVAIGLSAVGFSLLHISSMIAFGVDLVPALVGLVTITLAGVLLAVLYIYGGLLSAIGFHFIWNFLQYHVFGLGLRGAMPALLDVTQTGNVLITGGTFGPEVSIPGLAIIAITLGAVWYYYTKHRTGRAGRPDGKERQII